MSIEVSHSHATLQPPSAPPSSPVDTLPKATPEQANAIVETIDADSEARAAFKSDVQALAAGERQDLLNGLAGKLEASNLARLHNAFGADAVAKAVESHGGGEVQAAYQGGRMVREEASAPGLRQELNDPSAVRLEETQAPDICVSNEKTVKLKQELDSLQNDYDKAKSEVDKLNQELNEWLMRAGPLTDEQRAKFIEEFKNRDGRADVYKAEVEAGKKLAEYVSQNKQMLLTAAQCDPRLAEQVVEVIGRLSDSGHGEQALRLIGEILGASDGSSLAKAFAPHTDKLQGDLLERATGSAAAEMVARHDGDVQAAIKELKQVLEPFKQVKGLFESAKGVGNGFKDGMEMLDEIEAGKFDLLEKMGDDFGEGVKKSPFTRAISAAGIVLGAVKAGQSGLEGEYIEAVQGFASAGESGLNFLAAGTKHLANVGRLAQFGDDAVKLARLAVRIAPGLGALASATSMAINTQKAAEGKNFGYLLAVVGDAFSFMGSAVALFPPGAPAGAVVSGIGTLISTFGSFIGDAIDKHQNREELRDLLLVSGVDSEVVELMLDTGKEQNIVAAELDVSAEQWREMLLQDPILAEDPMLFKETVDAYGLKGEQVVKFFSKLHEGKPGDGTLNDLKTMKDALGVGFRGALDIRSFLEARIPGAHAYGRTQELSDTKPDGKKKSGAEKAEDDFSGIDAVTLVDIMPYAKELLERNNDREYRVRILQLLAECNTEMDQMYMFDQIYQLCEKYGIGRDEIFPS